MRLLMLSDIHSNIAALRAVVSDAGHVDGVAFAGDAVDYGPRPAECVDWLRRNAKWAVRGNHDDALANHTNCRSSARFRLMSVATRAMNQERVSQSDRDYLAGLPLTMRFEFDRTRFAMVHAAPGDPLYRYLPSDLTDAELTRELGEFVEEADVIVLGHTHQPFIRQLGRVRVINPGSVGQPKYGAPKVSYGIWENGALTLHPVSYPIGETISDLEMAGLPEGIARELIATLNRGLG